MKLCILSRTIVPLVVVRCRLDVDDSGSSRMRPTTRVRCCGWNLVASDVAPVEILKLVCFNRRTSLSERAGRGLHGPMLILPIFYCNKGSRGENILRNIVGNKGGLGGGYRTIMCNNAPFSVSGTTHFFSDTSTHPKSDP